MERVQFQQEQMLAELKDLVQKGLFSQSEIKQIVKKRSTFETALIRRIPKKSDFLRYAAYEMTLEALRRKRVERLNIPKGPPTISDFALIRRQFQIFERALRKFKDDVGLWMQYIQAAQRAQARALVSRICGRALQLHPNCPNLYIIAASHELKHLSHAAARVLLQRGIRMNGESIDLWKEYIKMELGFVESLRRRWDVLGLKVVESDPTDSEKDIIQDVEMVDAKGRTGSDGDENPTIMEEHDEQARQEILKGALVKTAISSAIKAVPTPDLFNAIHAVLAIYPCPPPLRRLLLDHLHCILYASFLSPPRVSGSSKASKIDPMAYARAAKLYATRFLTPDLDGDTLVEALRNANESLVEAVKARDSDEMASAYVQFVNEWFEKGIDEYLNLYLLSSLQALCSSSRSPPLLIAHIQLHRSHNNFAPLPPVKLLKLCRKYTARSPKDVDLWLLRLEIELAFKDVETVNWKDTWQEARKVFARSGVETSSIGSKRDSIWLWGLDHCGDMPLIDQISEVETLLRETRAEPSSTLSENLLIHYIRLLHRQTRLAIRTGEPSEYKGGDQSKDLIHLASRYFPSAAVWETTFDIYSQPDSDKESSVNLSSPKSSPSREELEREQDQALRTIFESWRLLTPDSQSAASLKWAGWLVKRGRGGEAARVIADARTALATDDAAASLFDQRWREVVDDLADCGVQEADGGDGAEVDEWWQCQSTSSWK